LRLTGNDHLWRRCSRARTDNGGTGIHGRLVSGVRLLCGRGLVCVRLLCGRGLVCGVRLHRRSCINWLHTRIATAIDGLHRCGRGTIRRRICCSCNHAGANNCRSRIHRWSPWRAASIAPHSSTSLNNDSNDGHDDKDWDDYADNHRSIHSGGRYVAVRARVRIRTGTTIRQIRAVL